MSQPELAGMLPVSTVVWIVGAVVTAMSGAIIALWRWHVTTDEKHDQEAQDRSDEQKAEIKALRDEVKSLRTQLSDQKIMFLQRQLDTLTVSGQDTRAAIKLVTERTK